MVVTFGLDIHSSALPDWFCLSREPGQGNGGDTYNTCPVRTERQGLLAYLGPSWEGLSRSFVPERTA